MTPFSLLTRKPNSTMIVKLALVLLFVGCQKEASGELSQDGLNKQADIQTQLRELQAVVKKLGEVAVRHTIALTTTESDVNGLETRLRAGELKADDQRKLAVGQTLRLNSVTSDMREVESRVETSERQSQQHQTKITQLGMKMEVAQMQLQASKKQVDRLQEENTGTISDQNKTNNQILAQNKELLQFP